MYLQIPYGNFKYFINQLEVILNNIYKASTYVIMCGDFNIKHFEESTRNNQLQSLFASYNLSSTVTFPTRIAPHSSTLIDNIYLDNDSCKYMVYPFTNGLSNRDAQIIEILNFYYNNHNNQNKFIRKIDSNTMFTFSQLLSQENWGEVFIDGDINCIFNNFLNTYLRI